MVYGKWSRARIEPRSGRVLGVLTDQFTTRLQRWLKYLVALEASTGVIGRGDHW